MSSTPANIYPSSSNNVPQETDFEKLHTQDEYTQATQINLSQLFPNNEIQTPPVPAFTTLVLKKTDPSSFLSGIISKFVTITNPVNGSSWTTIISDQESEQIKSVCVSRGSVDILQATLFPVRTNTLDNIARDTFLPTVVNRARKIENIFIAFAACCLDFITFPARIVTFIPRALYNAFRTEHPLLTYLKVEQHKPQSTLDPKVLLSDYLTVTLDGQDREITLIETPK